MIKTHEQYVLETAIEGLQPVVKALRHELDNLDPSAVYTARMELAKIEGILLFLESEQA